MSTHPQITDFYFVRHGPVVKRSGYLPSYDPPIVDTSLDLSLICQTLPNDADWHISPLLRTQQSAEILCANLSPNSLSKDGRLIEMNFGSWHDKPVSEVWSEIEQGPKHNWSFIMPETCPPDGEQFNEQCNRITSWMDYMATKTLDRPQIIVTHAGVIRAAMCHILRIPPVQAIGIPVAHFGCMTATMMEPSRASGAGGAWLFKSLQ